MTTEVPVTLIGTVTLPDPEPLPPQAAFRVLDVDLLRVSGRLELWFDDRSGPDGKMVDPYTELVVRRRSDGKTVASWVAHTRDTDGAWHGHSGDYGHDPGEVNDRRHHWTHQWASPATNGRAVLGVDDAILRVLKGSEFHIQASDGREYRLDVVAGKVTVTPVPVPPRGTPF